MTKIIVRTRREHATCIHVCGATLEADLVIPLGARGLVILSQYIDGGAFSHPCRVVAGWLQKAGWGTLLLGMLTPRESEMESYAGRSRPDVHLLADRLSATSDWCRRNYGETGRHLGYFGFAATAAAALVAAGSQPDAVKAVVAWNGPLSTNMREIFQIKAPTRLIVSEYDPGLLASNCQALRRLTSVKDLAVISRSPVMPDEPGAIQKVALSSIDWFQRHLNRPPQEGYG